MLYSAGVAPLVWGLRGDFSRVKVTSLSGEIRVPGIVVPENLGIVNLDYSIYRYRYL